MLSSYSQLTYWLFFQAKLEGAPRSASLYSDVSGNIEVAAIQRGWIGRPEQGVVQAVCVISPGGCERIKSKSTASRSKKIQTTPNQNRTKLNPLSSSCLEQGDGSFGFVFLLPKVM